MPLQIPDEPEQESGKKLRIRPKQPEDGPLSAEDNIEYGLTVEVSPGRGQKAWVKFGVNASIREGETTREARNRIVEFVNDEIDRRIEELS